MSRKANKKSKRVNRTPDQLLQPEFDKSMSRKFTPSPRPVSGVSDDSWDYVNDLLSCSILEEKARPAVEAGTGADIPAVNTLLLTVADLCALLQISRTTLFRMEKAGKVPGRLSLGGQVRYHRETVETWLRSQLKE